MSNKKIDVALEWKIAHYLVRDWSIADVCDELDLSFIGVIKLLATDSYKEKHNLILDHLLNNCDCGTLYSDSGNKIVQTNNNVPIFSTGEYYVYETKDPKTGEVKCHLEKRSKNAKMDNDPVNKPKHYTQHPSGVECLEIVRHCNFNIGNAIKYLWRHQDKGKPIEDLQKAVFYIQDEIDRLSKSERLDKLKQMPDATISPFGKKIVTAGGRPVPNTVAGMGELPIKDLGQ